MKNFIIYCICVIIVSVCLYVIYYYSGDKVSVKFDSCVDGDTVWLNINGNREKVRLLGIDAPEIEKDGANGEEYGEEARDYLCDRLSSSNDISILYDDNSDIRDKYGRVLGWLYVDNSNVNIELVSLGYARVKYVYGDYKYVRELCIRQEEAYNKRIGIWEDDSTYRDNYCVKKGLV